MKNTIDMSFLVSGLLAFSGSAMAQQVTPVTSRIDAATVYTNSARVTRIADPVTSDGRYVFQGLTSSLDRQNVRVRLTSGHVLGVEVKDRWVENNPEERVQALRDQLKELEREQQARRDEFTLLEELRANLEGQLAATQDVGEKPTLPALEAWQASHDYYAGELQDLLRMRRELRWEGEAADVRMQGLRNELGTLDVGGGVQVNDVYVDVDLGNGPGTLSLEYFVSGCGWSPTYDLRTSGDAREVELVYRAEVVQQSGEDWRGVELALSTAQPRRGAVGPELRQRWVDLGRRDQGWADDSRAVGRVDYRGLGAVERDKAFAPATATAVPFAVAQSSGLSVRFVLPARETLTSRPLPTTVLVGESTLAVEPELYCAPAIDETVWLRGRAKNSSPYVLLPGTAAIFFGDDFIGNAGLGQVQTGQELELALGAVPGITTERVLVAEEHDPPGFLSSTAEEISRWRVRLFNNGSPVSEADGSVRVVVREALPRSRDERLEVEVTESTHSLAKDPRWQRDFKDKSLMTWIVPVPAGGEVDLAWEVTISHPNSKEVVLD